MNKNSLIKLLFPLIGLAMLCGAAFSFINTQKFIKSASLSQATVIELVANHNDGTTYAPLYQFRTRQGQLIESLSNSSSNPPSYHVNERVVVYYNPHDPQDNKLDGTFSLWGVSIILGGMGGVFFILGMVFFWEGKEGKKYYRRILHKQFE